MEQLIHDDGENLAVRSFLLMYGGRVSCTVAGMREHMRLSGFPLWPEWVAKATLYEHLTKAGAQYWLRYLFDIEKAGAGTTATEWHNARSEPTAPLLAQVGSTDGLCSTGEK